MSKVLWYLCFSLILLALVAVLGVACTGAQGPIGEAGPAGATGPAGTMGPVGPAGISTGTISGTVTNSASVSGISGVDITASPGVAGLTIQTAANGTYTATLPVGAFTLTFTKTGFASTTKNISVIAGGTQTVNASLTPASPVVVNAGANLTGDPGSTIALSATVNTFDGSTITSYAWTSTKGVVATIATPASSSTSVTLGTFTAYKAALLNNLVIQNRNEVVAINPHSLELAETVTFTVTVTTSNGKNYSDSVDVVTNLPFVWNGGLADVPIGLPVLLNGKTGATYNWSISAKPATSSALIKDADTRNPYFTPDVVGKYTLSDSVNSNTIDVYAGTWSGSISGIGSDGLPDSENCISCHNDGAAYDMFTSWRASGHAEIFSVNLNTSTHYGDSCFACHTVGYSTSASNGGIDDATNYAAFLSAGIINTPKTTNWATVVNNYPSVAKLANIQCENCHGPNVGTTLHSNGGLGNFVTDPVRVSLSSDVCGACHGEPARHGRFQQWQESGHANYQLAIDESTNSSCARCHTGNGFVVWLDQGNLTKNIQDKTGAHNASAAELAALGISPDTAVPQTCATCHDPHALGTTSGEPNNVILRVQNNTSLLPAGFKALGVGNGALCMTCHNTRNGAHNDIAYKTAKMDDRAPHTAAQADVLMGENAFFIATGQRSAHSYVKDTCTNCHMQKSDPPAEYSYLLSGTNHDFKADTAICADCHAEITADAVQNATHAMIAELKSAIENAITKEVKAQITAGNTVKVTGTNSAGETGTALSVDMTDTTKLTAVEFSESHGRQAMNITYNGTTIYHVRLASDTKVGSGTNTLLTSASGQVIAKAGWNFFLIEGDASAGIHNPSFSNIVISASLAQLSAL